MSDDELQDRIYDVVQSLEEYNLLAYNAIMYSDNQDDVKRMALAYHELVRRKTERLHELLRDLYKGSIQNLPNIC